MAVDPTMHGSAEALTVLRRYLQQPNRSTTTAVDQAELIESLEASLELALYGNNNGRTRAELDDLFVVHMHLAQLRTRRDQELASAIRSVCAMAGVPMAEEPAAG